MRKRLISLSSSKLRKQFKDFDAYALQEKFQNSHSIAAPFNTSADSHQKLSLVSSAKKIDSVTPVGRKNKSTIQHSSVSRLYSGEQYKAVKPIQVNPVPNYSSQKDFQSFLSSLTISKSLEQDLELNYDVSHNYVGNSQLSLGLVFQIEEELKKYSEVPKQNFSSHMVLEGFQRLTVLLREILRTLKSKNMPDEAETLELFWRACIKLTDTALVAQEAQNLSEMKKIKEESRRMIEKSKEDARVIQLNFESEKNHLREELAATEQNFKMARKEFRILQERFNEKEGYLQELAEVDRFDVLKNTKKVLDDMTDILTKIGEERRFQLNMVSKLSDSNIIIK